MKNNLLLALALVCIAKPALAWKYIEEITDESAVRRGMYCRVVQPVENNPAQTVISGADVSLQMPLELKTSENGKEYIFGELTAYIANGMYVKMEVRMELSKKNRYVYEANNKMALYSNQAVLLADASAKARISGRYDSTPQLSISNPLRYKTGPDAIGPLRVFSVCTFNQDAQAQH